MREMNQQDLRDNLLTAASGGKPSVVRYLLEKGAPIDRQVTYYASKSGCVEVLQALQDHGWKVNDPTISGTTVLALAVEDEHMVRWLLSQGADPNRGAPLIGKGAVAESVPDSMDVINAAAAKASVAVMELLISHGARLGQATPLHAAAWSNLKPDSDRIPMIEFLLRTGLDINCVDHVRGPYCRGRPLDYAVMAENTRIVEYLLERGATFHPKSFWSLRKELPARNRELAGILDRYAGFQEGFGFGIAPVVRRYVPRHQRSDSDVLWLHGRLEDTRLSVAEKLILDMPLQRT
ncbi:ankyrin repeat-containing domain protein [Aspergillus coremiiformis]|uniref:Ankyrin repeat-containing domain protein n=1 Tax=Aspergillus coremiiformis TaxID=138285 RepID=A0A5N6ZIW4_9EURO|nr:ankyrin repeat-containing domain protein [Aspergillus coremiiformis]